MNFDYIECSQEITGKDKPILQDFQFEYRNRFNWSSYTITNVKSLTIRYNPEIGILKLAGSVPYFMEGNNFSPDISKINEAFIILTDMTGVNLMNATVTCFEFGKTFAADLAPEYYFPHHTGLNGFKRNAFAHDGIVYKSRFQHLKIYNAAKNIKQKLSKAEREHLSCEKGYAPHANYLRIEAKYLRPEVSFKERPTVSRMLSEQFQDKCKSDLIKTYQQVNKTTSYSLPANKKAYSLQKLAIKALQQYVGQSGIDAFELLRSEIKATPEGILNKHDKKNRLRALNRMKGTLKKDWHSAFDLEKYLLNP